MSMTTQIFCRFASVAFDGRDSFSLSENCTHEFHTSGDDFQEFARLKISEYLDNPMLKMSQSQWRKLSVVEDDGDSIINKTTYTDEKREPQDIRQQIAGRPEVLLVLEETSQKENSSEENCLTFRQWVTEDYYKCGKHFIDFAKGECENYFKMILWRPCCISIKIQLLYNDQVLERYEDRYDTYPDTPAGQVDVAPPVRESPVAARFRTGRLLCRPARQGEVVPFSQESRVDHLLNL